MDEVAFSCFVLFFLLVIAWHYGVSYLMLTSGYIEIVFMKLKVLYKVFDQTDKYFFPNIIL